MIEPILLEVQTVGTDAWFVEEGTWLVDENEMLAEGQPGARNLVVSNTRPVENGWPHYSGYAPEEGLLPDRVDLGDEWWGWWTSDLGRCRMVPLTSAPARIRRKFWQTRDINPRRQ